MSYWIWSLIVSVGGAIIGYITGWWAKHYYKDDS